MLDWRDGARGELVVDAVRLECACHGPSPRDAPTLVLLHEGLGSVALWRDFPERLAAATGRGVFAWSRAGYGGSDPVPLPRPLDYLEREAAEAVGPVLDGIGLRRGTLVGHSDGATIAALYAGRARDPRLDGVVLIAPHFFTEPAALEAIAETRRAYDGGRLRERLAKYHAHVDVAFRGWSDAWLDPGFAAWNVEGALDGLGVPALAIQGEDDAYGTRAQVDAVARRSPAPVEVRMLSGCGHAPHVEATEATLAAIAGFALGLPEARPARPRDRRSGA